MPILHRIAAVVVVVFGVIIYGATSGGTYHSLSCTLFNIGCPKPVVVDGYTSPRYEKMREVYQKLFDDGEDLASCFAVFGNISLVLYFYSQ